MTYIIYSSTEPIISKSSKNLLTIDSEVNIRRRGNPTVKAYLVKPGEPTKVKFWDVKNGELVLKKKSEIKDPFDIDIFNKYDHKKTVKETQIKHITVQTSNGNIFDGNEISQQRMITAITAAEILGDTEIKWKLAGNEIVTVRFDELKEALSLSVKALSELVLS